MSTKTEITLEKPLFIRVYDVSEEIMAGAIDLASAPIQLWIERITQAKNLESDQSFLALEFADYVPDFIGDTGDEKLNDRIWEEETVVLDKPFTFKAEVPRLAFCTQSVDKVRIHWEAAEKHTVTSFETSSLELTQLKGWL